MADLSFKKEFLDAGIVKDVKAWAFGSTPVVSPLQVGFAAGNNKFSMCAAFSFTSLKNDKFPTFKVVFCAKLHSKIFRRDPANRSSWYIWQPIGKSGCIVLDTDKCEEEYGFDFYKFIKTSEFKKAQKIFQKNILNGITEAKKLKDELPKEKQEEYDTYIKSLEEASTIITEIPDVNENTFKLIDFDKFIRELKDNGYGEELNSRGNTMTAYNRKVGTAFVDKVKRNALKAGEQDARAKAADKQSK